MKGLLSKWSIILVVWLVVGETYLRYLLVLLLNFWYCLLSVHLFSIPPFHLLQTSSNLSNLFHNSANNSFINELTFLYLKVMIIIIVWYWSVSITSSWNVRLASRNWVYCLSLSLKLHLPPLLLLNFQETWLMPLALQPFQIFLVFVPAVLKSVFFHIV